MLPSYRCVQCVVPLPPTSRRHLASWRPVKRDVRATMEVFENKAWAQLNKEIQVYFTSRTLVCTNSPQFESTKKSLQVPVRSLQLVLTMVFYWINQL